jgi:hypothetical protein
VCISVHAVLFGKVKNSNVMFLKLVFFRAAAVATMAAAAAAAVAAATAVLLGVVGIVVVIVVIVAAFIKQMTVVIVLLLLLLLVVLVLVGGSIGGSGSHLLLSVNGAIQHLLIVERIFSEGPNDVGVEVLRRKVGRRIFLQSRDGSFECAHDEMVLVKLLGQIDVRLFLGRHLVHVQL